MKTLRSRLVLSHLLPILITLPLTLLILSYVLETRVLLTNLSAGLTEEANLIALALAAGDVWESEAESQAYVERVSVHINGRLHLLAPDGTLLAGEGGEFEGLETAVSGQPSVIVTYHITQPRSETLIPVVDVNEELIGIVAVTESLDQTAAQFAQLRWLELGILAAELLIAGLIGFYLAHRLSRPLANAADAVVHIADGDVVLPLRETGARETRTLIRAVNQLSTRLQLSEASRHRSFANIVHELGRPLGAIRSATDVIAQPMGDDPVIRKEMAAGIIGAIERMEPLLDDLTHLHGQAEGELRLSKTAVSINEWLPPLLLPWRALAQEKGLGWKTAVTPNLPIMQIDPNRMGQVVGNLLSNAIKYSPAGEIIVIAHADDRALHIAVMDTGVGIVNDELQQIFEPFYRSQHERRFPQGLGVGLTIAQNIVEAHGGWIEVTAVLDEGSTFTIHIPIRDSK